MAVGGSGVHLSWFHLSNLFPEKRQTISSVIIAGFVGSGVSTHAICIHLVIL